MFKDPEKELMDNSRAFLMKEFVKVRNRFFSGDIGPLLKDKMSIMKNSQSTKAFQLKQHSPIKRDQPSQDTILETEPSDDYKSVRRAF